MPWYFTLLFGFLKTLLAGDFKRQWEEHKANEKAESLANIPETDNEWTKTADKGDL